MPQKSGNRFFVSRHARKTGPKASMISQPERRQVSHLARILRMDFPRIHMSEPEFPGTRDDLALDSEVAERLPLG